MFEEKQNNSLKGMGEMRKINMLTYIILGIITLLLAFYSVFFPGLLGFVVVSASLTIQANIDLRYWDLKTHLLVKTKLEKEKK